MPEFNVLPEHLWSNSDHFIAKKRHKCRCQSVTLVRKPVSPQCSSWPKIRSMKSFSFAVLKAEKAWAWQTPQTLCWEDSLIADAAVLRLPGILSLPGILLPVPVQSRNEQSIEQLLLCRKNISTFASSMSCQSCQLMWRSCCNPVHIDHQYWRKGRHAGVSQWPLCENHSLHSLHPRQSSDQWRVSPSQCWKLKMQDFGRRRKPCVKRILGCWFCCVTASRNPVATRNHVARSSPGQEWAEHWTNPAMLEEYKHLP